MCGHDVSLDDFNWRDVVDLEIQSHLQQVTPTYQHSKEIKVNAPLVMWLYHTKPIKAQVLFSMLSH